MSPDPSIPLVGADEVTGFGYPRAVRALEQALRDGLDPAADPARSTVELGDGTSMLFMPSVAATSAGVKVLTANPTNPRSGHPLFQGLYLLFDQPTLTPRAVLDGAALTTLRTPAMSIAAVRPALRTFDRPLRMVVFGLGPQGLGHFAALTGVADDDGDFPRPEQVTFVTRSEPATLPSRAGVLVRHIEAGSAEIGRVLSAADVVVCATSSPTPLFDDALLREHSVTIVVGSHRPDEAQVAPGFCARATVVVEDVAAALRESGPVVQAQRSGALRVDDLVPVTRAVASAADPLNAGRPVLFSGFGMAWQDRVVAAAIVHARPGS